MSTPRPATPLVDRCCCVNVRFCDLKRVSEATGTPLEVVIRETGCGSGCGLCRPYLRVMVRTGRTEIPLLTCDQICELTESPHAQADAAGVASNAK